MDLSLDSASLELVWLSVLHRTLRMLHTYGISYLFSSWESAFLSTQTEVLNLLGSGGPALGHGPSQNQKSPIVRWQHLRLQFAFLKSGLVRYNLQILKSPLSVQFYEIWNNPNQSISIIPPKLPYSLLHPFNHWSARFYLHPTVHSFLMLKRMSPCGSAVYPLSSQKTLVLFPVFVS